MTLIKPKTDRQASGGIVPGVMIGLALMALAFILASLRKYPKGEMVPIEPGTFMFFAALPAGTLTSPFIRTEEPSRLRYIW